LQNRFTFRSNRKGLRIATPLIYLFGLGFGDAGGLLPRPPPEGLPVVLGPLFGLGFLAIIINF